MKSGQLPSSPYLTLEDLVEHNVPDAKSVFTKYQLGRSNFMDAHRLYQDLGLAKLNADLDDPIPNNETTKQPKPRTQPLQSTKVGPQFKSTTQVMKEVETIF